jgi:hypothetical protein
MSRHLHQLLDLLHALAGRRGRPLQAGVLHVCVCVCGATRHAAITHTHTHMCWHTALCGRAQDAWRAATAAAAAAAAAACCSQMTHVAWPRNAPRALWAGF